MGPGFAPPQMCKNKVIYKVKTSQDECVKLIYLYIYLISFQKNIYTFNIVNKI